MSGSFGRTRPPSGQDDYGAPRARNRVESDMGGDGGRETGDAYTYSEYRGGGGGRNRDPSPTHDGPVVRGQAGGGGRARTSISPVARVRAVAVDGEDGGRSAGRSQNSASPVMRVRVAGYEDGKAAAALSGSVRNMNIDDGGYPAPQKFVGGRRPGGGYDEAPSGGQGNYGGSGYGGRDYGGGGGGGGGGGREYGGGGRGDQDYERPPGMNRSGSSHNFRADAEAPPPAAQARRRSSVVEGMAAAPPPQFNAARRRSVVE